jgi:hypothetical protein
MERVTGLTENLGLGPVNFCGWASAALQYDRLSTTI